MDALARSGATFERAFVSEAMCAPSRAALLTGLRPETTGITAIDGTVNRFVPGAVTMPDSFRAAGYETIRIGKVYNDAGDDADGWSKLILSAPIEYAPGDMFKASTMRWPDRKTTADYQNAQRAAAEFPRLARSGTPFFFAVGLFRPHMPFIAPAEDWNRYDPARFPAPRNAEGQHGAYAWSMTSDELWAYEDLYPDRPNLSAANAEKLTWAYLAAVSSVDYNVGLVMQGLHDAGLAENTIVVLWGDHGWKLGDHAYWGKKSNADIDIRIPLIVSAPGRVNPGIRVKGIVESIDIFPTLAEMTGVSLPGNAEGLSFKPLFDFPDAQWKPAALALFPRYARETGGQGDLMGQTVRTANYRYTAWTKAGSQTLVGQELYDLVADPQETVNVAARMPYAGVLDRLEQVRAGGGSPIRAQVVN